MKETSKTSCLQSCGTIALETLWEVLVVGHNSTIHKLNATALIVKPVPLTIDWIIIFIIHSAVESVWKTLGSLSTLHAWMAWVYHSIWTRTIIFVSMLCNRGCSLRFGISAHIVLTWDSKIYVNCQLVQPTCTRHRSLLEDVFICSSEDGRWLQMKHVTRNVSSTILTFYQAAH